jgi:putative hemolysin
MGEIVGQVKHEGIEEPFRQISNEVIQISGMTRVRDVNARLSTNLPESDQYDTVAGLVLSKLGHIPFQGERVNVDTICLEVAQTHQQRIDKINLIKTVKK